MQVEEVGYNLAITPVRQKQCDIKWREAHITNIDGLHFVRFHFSVL